MTSIICRSVPSRIEIWSGNMNQSLGLFSTSGDNIATFPISSLNPTVNPCFVHCLAKTDHIIFAGLGSGDIMLFSAKNRKEILRIEAHGAGVCCLSVWECPKTSDDSQIIFLLSAGLDKNLILWKLEKDVVKSKKKEEFYDFVKQKNITLNEKPNSLLVYSNQIFLTDCSSNVIIMPLDV